MATKNQSPEQKAPIRKEADQPAKKTAALAGETKKLEEAFDPYQILQRPLSTEKSLRQMEFENKLSFVIHSQATKRDVKRAVEMLFSAKVIAVNVQNAFKGEKRAVIRLSTAQSASDIGADLGLI